MERLSLDDERKSLICKDCFNSSIYFPSPESKLHIINVLLRAATAFSLQQPQLFFLINYTFSFRYHEPPISNVKLHKSVNYSTPRFSSFVIISAVTRVDPATFPYSSFSVLLESHTLLLGYKLTVNLYHAFC